MPGSLPRALAALATLATAAVLSGCAGTTDPEPSEITLDDPSAPATPTPEPATSAPAEEPLRTRYPDAGLRVTGLPQASEHRDALAAYLAFEHGRRLLMRHARMNQLAGRYAVGSALEDLRSTAAHLRDTGSRYSGDSLVVVREVQGDGRLVVVELCTDATGLRFVESGVAEPPTGPARLPSRVTVTNTGGTWRVSDASTVEGTC